MKLKFNYTVFGTISSLLFLTLCIDAASSSGSAAERDQADRKRTSAEAFNQRMKALREKDSRQYKEWFSETYTALQEWSNRTLDDIQIQNLLELFEDRIDAMSRCLDLCRETNDDQRRQFSCYSTAFLVELRKYIKTLNAKEVCISPKTARAIEELIRKYDLPTRCQKKPWHISQLPNTPAAELLRLPDPVNSGVNTSPQL